MEEEIRSEKTQRERKNNSNSGKKTIPHNCPVESLEQQQ